MQTKHTNKKCQVINGSVYDELDRPIAHMDREIGNGISPTERDANAKLIAESFNVANETGLTPRQLLKQRNELAKLVERLKFTLAGYMGKSPTAMQLDYDLITEAEKQLNSINL